MNVRMLEESENIYQFKQILTENASMVLNLDFQLDFIWQKESMAFNVNRIDSVDLVVHIDI